MATGVVGWLLNVGRCQVLVGGSACKVQQRHDSSMVCTLYADKATTAQPWLGYAVSIKVNTLNSTRTDEAVSTIRYVCRVHICTLAHACTMPRLGLGLFATGLGLGLVLQVRRLSAAVRRPWRVPCIPEPFV